MIYQATVTLHLRQAAVKVPGEAELPLDQPQQILVSRDQDKLVFMTPPSTACSRVYLAPYKFVEISSTECKFIHEQRKSRHHTISTDILTLKSTEQCISEIKRDFPARKYKSCLSFSPSQVRHISILSGESTSQRYRGFINLIVIMFIVLNLRNIYDNFLRYGVRFLQYPRDFIPLSAALGFVFLFGFVQVAFRIDRLRFHRLLSDRAVRTLLITNQFALLLFLYLYCSKYLTARPISGISLTTFGLVFTLKLISYMQVNSQIFSLLQRNSALARSQFSAYVFANHQISEYNLKIILEHRKNWQPLISRKRLFYFLIAPTLCYQLEYPRSPPIRYIWLVKRLIELLVVGALEGVIWVQYMEPELSRWTSEQDKIQSNFLESFNRLLRLSIPNTIGWILGFYIVFHLFLNIMSEIIRFGDRSFYEDWWNCRNLEQYWKTWNLPVHFFFIRHCYTPLLSMGWSKIGANVLVFFVSAIAHEYLVDVPLGLLSYYAFLAMLLQAPVIIIQKKISKMLGIQNSELGNVSFWLFFCFLGQPTILFIYYSLYMKAQMPTETS